MIAKVGQRRGSRARGLIEYLFGPGRGNEHERPRVVAAWDESYIRGAADPVLESAERGELARAMEAPLRLHGHGLGKHVYHVVISLDPSDGALSDEQWHTVANRAAEVLGFTETGTRGAAPWAAVEHGPGNSGQHHVHFVGVPVREDGTKVNLHNDFKRLEQVRAEFEQRWNLTPTVRGGLGGVAYQQGEAARAGREGRAEPDRTWLARTVRSAAWGAGSEAEFLRRVRSDGVLIRPRREQGTEGPVVGYSVATRPRSGRPVWYGGGTLGKDLRLPALRRQWSRPTEAEAAEADLLWRPSARSGPARRLRPEAWDQAGRVVGDFRGQLAGLDAADWASWAAVSRQVSASLGALATRFEHGQRGALTRAADQLARAGQLPSRQRERPTERVGGALSTIARVSSDALLASQGGPVAVITLVMQLGRLATAVQSAHEAGGRAAQAHAAERATGELLEWVRTTPRGGWAAELEQARSQPVEPATSPEHGQGRGDDERGR